MRNKNSNPWQLFTINYGSFLNKSIQENYYKGLLLKIIKIIEETRVGYKIFIISQGNIEDFNAFSDIPNTSIQLNNYAPDDFWHFVNADIFIMAKSSFSYLASLLNNNIKIINSEFRHYLPNETIILDSKYNSIKNKPPLETIIKNYKKL